MTTGPRAALADSPGISDGDGTGLLDGADGRRVRRMRLAARALDDLFRIPGTNRRFGLDPVLGVIPVVGDVVTAVVSLYVVVAAARLGVSYRTLARMVVNVVLDFGGGLVPYAGTLVDAYWKANQRNLDLALSDLETGRSDTLFAARVDD